MNTINFNTPSTLLIGGDVSIELPNQVKKFGANRALLVTDGYMGKSGLVAKYVNLLNDANIDTTVFDEVQPDPTDQNVLNGLKMFQNSHSEVIVALGGGSPIDTAKTIGILTTNPQPLNQYAGLHKVKSAGVPLIAIPTTAGTGSEATKVAVITDTQRDIKMMMLDVNLLPKVALVDYKLTMSMPASLTAFVGVDSLTHAIEAYVSRKANAITDLFALSTIRLVKEHLITAWREPNNEKAREGMMLASCQGGIAFTNSSVCLVHGMSRPIGAIFHLPHGLSNAVLLPTVTEYSISGAMERYATVSRILGFATDSASDESAAHALPAGLEKLNQILEIPRLGNCKGMEQTRFNEVLDKIATDALNSGSPQNNPRVPSHEEIMELYRKAW